MKIAFTLIGFLTLLAFLPLNAQEKWTLEDCIKRAKKQNAEVVIQQLRNSVLNSEVKMAKNERLPSMHFSLSQNYSLGNSFNVSTGVGQLSNSSTFLGLNTNFTLFDGFRYKYQLQKSKLMAQKGKAELDQIRFNLSINILEQYLQILFFKETLNAAEEQRSISQRNLSRIEQLAQRAHAGKRDLLETQATLAADTKDVIAAKNNIDNSLLKLSTLLQLEDTITFDIEEVPLETVESLKAFNNNYNPLLYTGHPRLVASRFAVEIRKNEIALNKANFYPTVNLGYSLSSNYFHIIGQRDVVYNQETNQLEANGFWQQFNNNLTHFIGVTAMVPIFNKFVNKQNDQIAREELDIARVSRDNELLKLQKEIQIIRNDVKTAWANYETVKSALSIQEEAFNIVQEKYNRGNIPNFEFLEAKSLLIQRQSDYIKAKYQYLFKTKLLQMFYVLY